MSHRTLVACSGAWLDEPASMPAVGDLLVGKPPGAVDHELTMVPDFDSALCDRLEHSIALGFELALRLGVDLWTTEDYLHFDRVAGWRTRPQAE